MNSAERVRKLRVRKLSAAALQSAMDEDRGGVTAAMAALISECGGAGISFALRAWIDTLVDAQQQAGLLPAGESVRARPVWIEDDTGQVDTDANQVPAAARWAGQLATARLAMDEDMVTALIAAIPPGRDAAREHISAVLTGTALGLNSLRGVSN